MDPSRGSQPAREDSQADNTRRAHLPDLFGLEYSESAPSLYKSKPTEVLVLEDDEDSDEEMDEVRVQAAVEPGSWEGAEEEQEELAKVGG